MKTKHKKITLLLVALLAFAVQNGLAIPPGHAYRANKGATAKDLK